MKSLKISLLMPFLFLLAICLTVEAVTLEEVLKKKIELPREGTLELSNVNGKIEVQGWDREEVYLEAYKKVSAGSERKAREGLEEVRIVIEQIGDNVRIDTKSPHRGGFNLFDLIFGDHINYSVNYTLRVPENCHLKLKTTNGSISIQDVNGLLYLKTTNGKIVAEDVSGLVNAHTTNGSIQVKLREVSPDGEMEFVTTNGSITLHLPEDIACTIRARTTNGSINSDFPVSVQGKFTSKRLHGEINGGGLPIFLETTNGSIKIYKW